MQMFIVHSFQHATLENKNAGNMAGAFVNFGCDQCGQMRHIVPSLKYTRQTLPTYSVEWNDFNDANMSRFWNAALRISSAVANWYVRGSNSRSVFKSTNCVVKLVNFFMVIGFCALFMVLMYTNIHCDKTFDRKKMNFVVHA